MLSWSRTLTCPEGCPEVVWWAVLEARGQWCEFRTQSAHPELVLGLFWFSFLVVLVQCLLCTLPFRYQCSSSAEVILKYNPLPLTHPAPLPPGPSRTHLCLCPHKNISFSGRMWNLFYGRGGGNRTDDVGHEKRAHYQLSYANRVRR